MEGAQRGKLILEAVPNREVEQNVVIYLSRLTRHVPPEVLAAKITRTPIILSKNILAEQGVKIAADLEKLGASAAFIPHGARGTGVKQTLAKPSPVSPPLPKHGGKKWGHYVLCHF